MTQQNNKCWLCGDKDGTINHNKLMQQINTEYKIGHKWLGKVIHWELCKKFKFDHTNKWYMPNPESVLENKKHKILRDF